MRIVHMTSVHVWSDTRIFTRMCATLAAQGHDVHFVVPIAEPPPFEMRRNVTFHVLPLAKSRWTRMTVTCARVLREARRIDADIYHFHDPELIPAALWLRATGRRVVYDIHEHVADEVANKKYLPSFVRGAAAGIVRFLSSFAIRRFSGIVTAGEDITAKVQEDARRIETICNYPDLELLDACLAGKSHAAIESSDSNTVPRYAVFFGGIRHNNVALNIVRAMGLVPERFGLRLLLGGVVHASDKERMIHQLPGWAQTESVGYVDFENMLRMSAGATCALSLYAREPNSENVRSNRLFESLAMRLPVITPDFPQWRAFLEKYRCGIAVNPDDPEQIAAAIITLLEDPAGAEEMGQRGRKLVENAWSWAHEYPKLERLYQDIVDADGS